MVLKIFEVVPESCQRTDGIKAWLETKEEREERQFRKDKILFAKNSFLFLIIYFISAKIFGAVVTCISFL